MITLRLATKQLLEHVIRPASRKFNDRQPILGEPSLLHACFARLPASLGEPSQYFFVCRFEQIACREAINAPTEKTISSLEFHG
jgi:hypothetical protein